MKEINEYEVSVSVRALVDRASRLSDGDEKIMTLEEAVRIADTGNDIQLQYNAREELVEAAFWGGEADKALVAYSWCLAQFDKNPEQFSEWMLLWRYKWIVNIIMDFPQIPKEQIFEMLDEMERRYLQAGYGLRVVYYYRYRTNKFFGHRDEALRHYRYAQTLGRDLLSDCPACETDERVAYQIYCGANDVALRIAEPLINGSKTCRSVPQRTFATLLIPLVKLGRWKEAYDYHLRGYQMITSRVSLLTYVSDHLLFVGLYGDFEKGTQILERHFRWTIKNTNVHDRYLFFRAAWMFLELMLDSGRETIKLRMPESFPLYQYSQNHHYEVSRLKELLESRTRELAEKFDKRNGTDHFATEMTEMLALKELKRPSKNHADS